MIDFAETETNTSPESGVQPEADGQERDRYAAGRYVDWADLIDSRAFIPAASNLEEVQNFFRDNEDLKFATVLDGERIMGLCSERRVSRILSMRGGLGFSVYSKNSVLRHMRSDHMVVNRGAEVLEVLDKVMGRQENFFDDVILTDQQGKYMGLIGARTLMILQHRISHAQLGELQDLSEALNRNNQDLAKARDVATQAAESKSAFLANMSHEIRTPLNGILGMTRILMRTELAPEQRRFSNTVLNSANALLTILNDILDFSKIDAGKMTIESVDVDVAEVVREVVELLSERASEKKIGLTCRMDTGTVTQVLSDPTRLRQVILNLVSNAVKFTSEGAVEVRVESLLENATQVELRVSVKDSGIGIAPEAQTRLFGAFEQADTSTSRRYGGTGLGLAICKRIIALMGGKIGLHSEVGVGSTFWFEIVVPKQAKTVESAGDQVPPQQVAVQAAVPAMSLLLVEDSPVNREVGILQLEALGHRVETAEHGLNALEKLKGTRYDCVLMDCQMPEMDGYEATRAIRSGAEGVLDPGVFIIAMTANAMPGDREKCLQAGMNDYVGKPVEERDLVRALRRAHEHTLVKQDSGAVAEENVPQEEVVTPKEAEEEPYFPARLVNMFVSETESRLQDLCRALVRCDTAEARRITHTIKGTAGNFRAQRLYGLAREMELRAADGDPEGVWLLLPEARQAFGEARARFLEKSS